MPETTSQTPAPTGRRKVVVTFRKTIEFLLDLPEDAKTTAELLTAIENEPSKPGSLSLGDGSTYSIPYTCTDTKHAIPLSGLLYNPVAELSLAIPDEITIDSALRGNYPITVRLSRNTSTRDCEEIAVSVGWHDTVCDLKRQISATAPAASLLRAYGTAWADRLLIFNGQIMLDSQRLVKCGIDKHCTVKIADSFALGFEFLGKYGRSNELRKSFSH
jgi:hypothetical protein